MKRTFLFGLAGFTALALLAWGVNVGLQSLARTESPDAPVAAAPAPAPTAHITATLFYGARDGLLLQPVRVECRSPRARLRRAQNRPRWLAAAAGAVRPGDSRRHHAQGRSTCVGGDAFVT
jgi:hypothetical protein